MTLFLITLTLSDIFLLRAKGFAVFLPSPSSSKDAGNGGAVPKGSSPSEESNPPNSSSSDADVASAGESVAAAGAGTAGVTFLGRRIRCQGFKLKN
jgi:hypothetical protein